MSLNLLLLCWGSSILAVTSCFRVDGYLCVTDYWDKISCVLNITDPAEQSGNYSLRFTRHVRKFDSCKLTEVSCPLVAMDYSYSCVCKAACSSNFSSYDEYDICICDSSDCQPLEMKFRPADNIQLTPPYDVQIEESAESCNITWKSGYETHVYIANDLQYEVSIILQTSSGKESILPLVNIKKKLVEVHKSQLTGDVVRWCVKVKSRPLYYPKSIWSGWSQETCRNNQTEEEQDNILVILVKCLSPVCAAVGVVMLLLYNPALRMKIKMLSHTPSPAPYFQSLFQHHGGNFQEWLSPGGRCVLTYKAEELTTSAVTFCDKAVAKEPRESQDFPQTAGTQLQFTQCQSYVCLPAAQEFVPPLTTVCPGDMPYTRLPCSVRGMVEQVPEEENKVISQLPKVFLNISQEDSGCSFDDSVQSPECSLPSSPAKDRAPPLCPCSDYCILNKTAAGFDPVLVSKVTGLNTPFDSLQKHKS